MVRSVVTADLSVAGEIDAELIAVKSRIAHQTVNIATAMMNPANKQMIHVGNRVLGFA
jgi:hypothetical protein